MKNTRSETYPISAVIIACNEEENILCCLSSLQEWVSEMIVVVNDCTDATIQIARGLGARVIEHPWEGYSGQKNFATKLATQPWILSIDADEEISPTLKTSIQAFFLKEASIHDGASFSRKVYFQEQWIDHGDWYPDEVLRLYRKNKAFWEENIVHEHLKVVGKTKKLTGDLWHYTYASFKEQIVTGLKYIDLQVDKNPMRKTQVWEIFAHPVWKIFRGYILKKGFIDGFLGLYIALTQGFLTLYRYARLYERYKAETKFIKDTPKPKRRF